MTKSETPQDTDLIKETLRAVLTDKSAAAAAKVSAAKTLAEINGLIGRNAIPDKGDKSPAEMTDAELNEALEKAISAGNAR